MPARVIRPDLLHSERYDSLSSDSARLVFIHLMLTVDDFGNCERSERPLLRRVQPVDVAGPEEFRLILNELEAADLIRFYEVDGKQYVHVMRLRARKRHFVRACPPSPYENDIQDYQRLAGKTADGRQTDGSRASGGRPAPVGFSPPAVAVAVAVADADAVGEVTEISGSNPNDDRSRSTTLVDENASEAGECSRGADACASGAGGKGNGKRPPPKPRKAPRVEAGDRNAPMDRAGFIDWLTKGRGPSGDGVRPDDSLLCNFAIAAGANFETRAAWKVWMQRHRRAAVDLSAFEPSRIADAWRAVRADVQAGRYPRFTLETVVKYATAGKADAVRKPRGQYVPHRT